MFRRLLIFNLFLVLVMAAVLVKLRRDAIAFSASHRVDQILPQGEKPVSKTAAAAVPATEEWGDIAAHDPFSFDRNDVTVVASVAAAPQPRRPKPFLFGTLVLGKDRMAMLAPGDSGGNRSSIPVKVGETIDGWRVVEIKDKSAVVQWDEIKESVIMNDPTVQVPRDYSKTGAAPGGPPAVVNVAAPSVPAVPGNTPGPPSTNSGATATPTAPKQKLILTPFGPKFIDDTP